MLDKLNSFVEGGMYTYEDHTELHGLGYKSIGTDEHVARSGTIIDLRWGNLA